LTYGCVTVFFDLLKMDRARGLRYSAVVLFVAALAVTMLSGAILILLPAAWKLAAVLFALIPVAITVCGIISLLMAGKPANITLLWIIIMILAPFLGPLLWFAWGRRNT
jgi:hypothetical protein